MIKEAEKNAAIDKSKKALVNIVYEFDSFMNKYSKSVKFINELTIQNYITKVFLMETVKHLQTSFNKKELKNISEIYLNRVKVSHTLIIFEACKSYFEILQAKSNKKGSKVIDIDAY